MDSSAKALTQPGPAAPRVSHRRGPEAPRSAARRRHPAATGHFVAPRTSSFALPRLSERIRPFAVVAAVPFVALPLVPGPFHFATYGAAVIGLLAVALTVAVVPWTRASKWVPTIPPLMYLVVVALLRDASVDATPMMSALALLPLFWVSLYGVKVEYYAVAAGILGLFWLPVFLIGGESYPAAHLIEGVVLLFVGGIVGVSMQRLGTRLRSVHAEFSETLTGALDGFLSTGADGRIVSWTPKSTAILGWLPDEVIGRPLTDIVPSLSGILPSFAPNAPMETTPAPVSASALHRNGWQVPVHLSMTAVRDRDGADRINLFLQDSTDRKRVIDKLIATEHRFETMFESAPIGTVLVDLNGQVVMANDAYCALFGLSREDVEHRSLMDLVHPEDAEGVRRSVEAIATGQRTNSREERRRRLPDGSMGSVQVHKSLIRGPQGNPEYILAHVIDITDQLRFEEQLQYQANHDPLTSLVNRRGFAAELDRQVGLVRRYGPSGALLMLDLDGFKYVNDTLGHNAGDELIVAVSRVLRSRLRETDVLARLGGDEFAVILPHVSTDEATLVADNLVEAVRDATLIERPLLRPVTASVGVAAFCGADITADEMMMRADLAMYDAKDRGKNQSACYDTPDSTEPRSQARLTWVDQINHALLHDGFVLEAQPIIDLRSGRITEYELLIRMVDGEGELIPPGTFLYIAERFDLITDIDRWVAREAISLLARRPDIPVDVGLTVNLSGKSIASTVLADEIEAELKRTGVCPRRLTFELTETAAVSDVPAARRFAERLSRLGCSFALDDFGAGFGSFYYLKHLPVDLIKIDGEFVRNCVSNKSDQVTIESVVHLARGLGKKTVAEFVTDDETRDLLITLGVDGGQGFHIGRPFTVNDAMDATHAEHLLPIGL
jgi:diguanylate cyclase (GGDEF)-like protein/PAS domain S-box-containing protein